MPRQAGRIPNPEAIVRMESAPIQGRTFGEVEYPLGLSQTIPLGGRLSKARQIEQLDRQRLAFESEAKRRKIRKRVQASFATALYQGRAEQTQRELAASAEQVAAIIKARMLSGDALPEDVARAAIELALVKVEQQRTESLRGQAFVALADAMGESRRRIESLDGALETALEIPALESIAADLEQSPATAASDAEVAVRAARVNLAKAERIPILNVEALYRRLEGERTHSFDVGLRIPLPLFDQSRGKLRAARAELGAAEARARSTRNELSARLSEAHATLTTALANARSLQAEILPRADTPSGRPPRPVTPRATSAWGNCSLCATTGRRYN